MPIAYANQRMCLESPYDAIHGRCNGRQNWRRYGRLRAGEVAQEETECNCCDELLRHAESLTRGYCGRASVRRRTGANCGLARVATSSPSKSARRPEYYDHMLMRWSIRSVTPSRVCDRDSSPTISQSKGSGPHIVPALLDAQIGAVSVESGPVGLREIFLEKAGDSK